MLSADSSQLYDPILRSTIPAIAVLLSSWSLEPLVVLDILRPKTWVHHFFLGVARDSYDVTFCVPFRRGLVLDILGFNFNPLLCHVVGYRFWSGLWDISETGKKERYYVEPQILLWAYGSPERQCRRSC